LKIRNKDRTCYPICYIGWKNGEKLHLISVLHNSVFTWC